MNKVKMTSLVCGSVLSLSTGSAFAQQSSTLPDSTSPSQSGTGTAGQSSTLGQGSSSSTYQSSTHGHMSQNGQAVRLSNLLHANVQSQDGKSLGHIRDLTVDPQSGQIEFAILALNSSSSSLGGSSSSGSLGSSTSGSSSSGTLGSSTTPSGATDNSTSGRETVPSSRSSSGTLGSSSTSGTLGNSSSYSTIGKMVPVPWQLFSQNWSNSRMSDTTPGSTTSPSASSSTSSGVSSSTSGNSSATSWAGSPTLVLNVDESKLQAAPSFDASSWNNVQQGTLDQQVYSYFGVNRMSGTGTSGSTISGQGAGSHDSSTGHDSSSGTKHDKYEKNK